MITLPVFDGFMRENVLKTAKSRLERAVHAEGLARQQIAKDVNQDRGIQLEVLDAQVALTRARFNAVNALGEYQSAQAMWLRALGRVR